MIHSLQIKKWGGPEVLQLVEEIELPLRAQGIRIQVHACGVNFADLMMRMGAYPESPSPPFTPGYEVAGTVLEVGSGVKNFHPGDRVIAGTRFGGYTSQIIVQAYQVRKTPSRLTDIEAAAIPVNFLTAWIALHEMARVKKGDRVLIQSAAGGVGMAAVQMASQAGAHTIGLVGNSSKKEFVQSLGAKEVFTHQEWEELSEHESQSFQIILDSTGGASLKTNFRKLSSSGRIISFGVSSLTQGKKRSLIQALGLLIQTPIFTPFKLMMENKGVFGLNMLQFFEEPVHGKFNPMFTAFDEILKRFEDGSFQVKIGKTFPLAQGGEAHNYLQSRANIGKVVLIPPHSHL